MARLARAAAFALAIASACQPGSTYVGTSIPPEVDWIAALALADDGSLIAASPLAPAAQAAAFTLPDRDRLVVLGYRDDDLLPQRPDEGRLAIAGPCEPRLPAPWFAGEIRGAATTVVPLTGSPPEVTAPWLVCPSPGRELLIDTRCSGTTDPARATLAVSAPGCAAELDLRDARGPVLRGHLRLAGGFCLPRRSETDVCTVDTSHDQDEAVWSSIRCTAPVPCTLDLYAPRNTAIAEVTARWKVHPSYTPTLAVAYSPDTGPAPDQTHYGGVADVIALNDRLIVSSFAGLTSMEICDLSTPGLIVSLAQGSLQVIDTATAPPCLVRLMRDPQPGKRGFIGAFGSTRPFHVARFDERGRRVQTQAIDISEDKIDAERIVDVVLTDAPRRIAVLVATAGYHEDVRHAWWVATFDPATLEQTATYSSTTADREFSNATALAGGHGQVVVGASDQDRLATIDLASGRLESTQVTRFNLYSESFASLHWDAARALLFVALSGTAGRVFEVSAGQLTQRPVRPFDADAALHVLHPWPRAPDRYLAVGGTLFKGRAFPQPVLSLLEIRAQSEHRFLPQTMEISGFGPITRMAHDRENRLYLLMPWAGELVAVETRDPVNPR